MLVTLSTWVTLFALYLLFAGQATAAEVCAGALAAGTGMGLRIYSHRAGQRSLRVDAPWGRLAGRLGVSLARDTIAVAGALARASVGRPVSGLVQRQDFIIGGEMDAGRRAVVILAASVAPNGFVARVAPEDEDEALLMHRLVSAPPKEDRRWPV
jgi:hypothetical protein